MKRNPIETVLGAVVLLVAGMFLYLAYSTAQVATTSGYSVSASFLKVGGLQVGSEVRISGIAVGTVAKQSLDTDTFEARVEMVIDPDVSLPDDTIAAIVGDGLLGGKYVDLRPGSSSELLKDSGEIKRSEDFQSLEDLVGEIIFLATGGD
jgi:phospholipid/cholesterol/gamma-HCH transport system substrate-binding protein